ncbi:uroporphyrinogen-III C-methyltransferase [soil metagenome]
MKARGTIVFIGAGPGDPRLLTLRGAELIDRASVIVHEEGVHEDTLARAPTAARIEKRRDAAPETVADDLIRLAHAGHDVARIFVGDPFAFRGGTVELARIRAAGFPGEVVAGVIAPTAAAVYTGLALNRASDVTPSIALAVVNDAANLHDWTKLSLATNTLVLVVHFHQVEEISETLTYYGRPPQTPAALVRDVSLPSQRVVLDTLVGVRKLAASFGEGHGLLLVGDSLAERALLRWFEGRPLFGKRVLVARAEGQARRTAALLRARGAEHGRAPTIACVPAPDQASVDAALDRLGSYGAVVFTSENGVRTFFGALAARGSDARALAAAKVGVVGPATRDALLERGVRADVMAKEFRGEGLAEALLQSFGDERPRVLVARARDAREILPDTLRAAGCTVDVIALYATVPAPCAADRSRALMSGAEGGVDAVLFTSASTVDQFADALAGAPLSPAVRVASIGPITSDAARKRGFSVQVEAPESTVAALIGALEASYGT